MHLHAYACICMHMHACACICMHMHAFACICMHMHAYPCICMHMHAYACICDACRGQGGGTLPLGGVHSDQGPGPILFFVMFTQNLFFLVRFLRIRPVQSVINNPTQLSGRGFPHIFHMKLVLSQLYVFLYSKLKVGPCNLKF